MDDVAGTYYGRSESRTPSEMKTNDGGPAFPVIRMPLDPDTILNRPGMSLKAYIATAALAGWASGRNIRSDVSFTGATHHQQVASECVLYADALIAELNKE